ncbi:MAG: response regulator transcription factor [Kiritimatiellae bacterium]|nr:response regulator transcription factor [Kiritimatiellia bacterium]
MEVKRTILIADDERSVRSAFKAIFEAEGYNVVLARDGVEAILNFEEKRIDLILMDVMMPRKNGLVACAEIRKKDPLIPILFFTAMPTDVSMVSAFGFGADDYIAKDRTPEEFLLRAKTALRRSAAIGAALEADEVETGEVWQIGDAIVRFSDMTIVLDGVENVFTRSEFLMLKLLMKEPGRYFSYDEIFAALRGEGYIGDEGAVRSIVFRLKNKFGPLASSFVSARGCGYAINANIQRIR